MKKSLILIILATTFFPDLHSKCINILHKKKRIVLAEGGKKEPTNEYQCLIKASEADVFDKNGTCKFCGCNSTNHDQT